MLFFMGAANTLDTCEADNFQTWLKVYGLIPMCSGMFVQLIATVWACMGSSEMFKNALRLQGVTILVSIALLIWGWTEYSETSETACVGDGGVNPRTLALVNLIMGSISMPCMFCASLKQMV